MKKFNKLRKLFILLIMSLTPLLIYKKTNKNNINYLAIEDNVYINENNYSYSKYIKEYLKDKNTLKLYTNEFSDKYLNINNLYKDILINKKVKHNNKELNLKKCLREADILTLSIGINDLIYRINITENINKYKINKIVKDINDNFNILINEIKKYYKFNIYVVGYYNIYPENDIYNYSIKLLNSKIKNNKDIVYIDVENDINLEKYQLGPNNYHLNQDGYRKITNLIIKKLKNDLKNK